MGPHGVDNVALDASRAGHAPTAPNLSFCCGAERQARRVTAPLALVVIATALAFLPHRTEIPPVVESDYCYLLLAADRLYDGDGLTSLQPVAPNQPWAWQADWAFLTKWPMGYPLLVCAARIILQIPTIEACRWISVVACALSLVGWFLWVRRAAPRGAAGVLLAAIAAACSVSASSLVNPSTDMLVVAALPYVLLCTIRGIEKPVRAAGRSSARRDWIRLAVAGLAAGGLFWIRYAAIFVPAAIGAHLLFEWLVRRTIRPRQFAVFAICAALPVIAILVVNRVLGAGESTQAQLNLGHSIGFDLSPLLFAEAWWRLTNLGFYDYHRLSHWACALWPAAMLTIVLAIPAARSAARSFAATPAVGLSIFVVAGLLAMLIGATTFFGNKYDYVAWDRYYMPGRPLYFVLFAAPVLLIPCRVVRVLACATLIIAASWIVRQEWPRPYQRWLAANRETTPYGQWGACFRPNASGLYRWLGEQAGSDLIVVSNFHEYITLETRIPALPIPPSVPALDDWIERICESRGVTHPRVLFVLDPDNRWRDYWIPQPAEIVRMFGLQDRPGAPRGISALVLEYSKSKAATSAVGTGI